MVRRHTSMSYGELAVRRTVPLFDTVNTHLANLTPSLAPHDAKLKSLRKDVQRLRDHLDIFAFAWPDFIRWRALRDELDRGYEALGQFKDLFDSQRAALRKNHEPTYDARELAKRRAALLKWVVAFHKPRQLKVWRAFLASPAPSIADIERRHLTKFFWGSVHFRPRTDDSGLVTIGRLAGALAKNAARSVKKTSVLSPLTRARNEKAFHDTRKRLRAAVNLFRNFADVCPPPPPLVLVSEAVARYGDLEDQLVAWHLTSEKGQRRLERELKTAWKKLREWQKHKDLVGVLKMLAD
jgi:hypothetical protein